MSDGGAMEGLPPGWAWARLGDLAANESNAMTDGPFGSKLKSEHYREDGIRVVRLGNIGLGRFIDQDKAFVDRAREEELQKHRCFEGDLLIAALAEPVGRCAIVPAGLGDAIVKADCIRMKVHGALDPRYVAFALNSPAGLARTALSSHGIGRLRINLGELKDVTIPTAPAAEQRRIVAMLDELLSRSRAAREALDAVPAMLEHYRKSVLSAAFSGELTAEVRARNATPPSMIDESAAPTHWDIVDLGSLVTSMSAGKSFRCIERPPTPSEVGIVKVSAVTWGTYDELESKTCESTTLFNPTHLIQPGDFLFSRANTLELVGACVIVGEVSRRIMLSDKILRFTFAQVSPRYILWYLRSPQGRSEIERLATGNQDGMRNIGQDRIRQISVPLPARDEQDEIVRRVEAALARIERVKSAVETQRAQLDALDRAILDKAFRGALVPQDPNDEPAAVMLERLRAEREGSEATAPRRGRGAKRSQT